jgi:osmotically-inducible protein OsmY
MRRVLDSLADYGEKGVELTVANGQVRIAGDVNSTEQYRRIGEVVENTRGVESVINDLTVRGDTPRQALTPYMVTARVLMPRDEWAPQPPTERSLFDAVQSELFWSPFVDEDDVEIEVDDGTVTLRGTVDSMNELLAAAENAYEAGALIVRNELTVE